MKLKQILTDIQQQMATQVPAEILTAFGESLTQLINDDIEMNALKLGDQAPNFSLLRCDDTEVELYELLKNGSVVINFFRGNWCPFCMAELKHYQEKLTGVNTDLSQFVFISPQKQEYHASLEHDKEIRLQLLSDPNNKVARQFGLVFALQENIQAIYKAIGADLSAFNGDDSFELPIPATYIIDPTGKITYAFVEPNYMIRAEVDEVVANLSIR